MNKYTKLLYVIGVFAFFVSISLFIFGSESVYAGSAMIIPLVAFTIFMGYAYEHHPEKFKNFIPMEPTDDEKKKKEVNKNALFIALIIIATGVVGIFGINFLYADYGDIRDIVITSITLFIGVVIYAILRYYSSQGYGLFHVQKALGPKKWKIFSTVLVTVLIIIVIIIAYVMIVTLS